MLKTNMLGVSATIEKNMSGPSWRRGESNQTFYQVLHQEPIKMSSWLWLWVEFNSLLSLNPYCLWQMEGRAIGGKIGQTDCVLGKPGALHSSALTGGVSRLHCNSLSSPARWGLQFHLFLGLLWLLGKILHGKNLLLLMLSVGAMCIFSETTGPERVFSDDHGRNNVLRQCYFSGMGVTGGWL